ncbi:hypothetical protein GSI_04719 [Ganoderma sinense ZZ0214-1]|uniref:BTB domain-containing protein n=1 Tax=Ganoderma sinense ZZ0214-1 TaxID=1077348 RepID=A0A2G8SHM4_9APHY|nr:hypothetical protein GSI_04719 [Ganoderma sinense ZZ0214-1]
MSCASAPARKRARVEDEDRAGDPRLPASGLEKDDDVWLSDGSIVVVAAADNVAFRVHKSTLARRSEIFRDLFSLPNADAATAEAIEGCPVVHISDASDDIRHLFLVLCCGKNYYYDGDVLLAVPFEVLASLIRMAHKYAIPDVLDHALSRLKRYYPSDLAAWRDSASRARYVTTRPEHAPEVVALARLTDTPSLLPSALLLCTGLLTTYGLPRAGGAFEFKLAALPVPDQALLIAAWGYLINLCAERALCLLAAVPCAGCTQPEVCRAAKDAPLVALRGGAASSAGPLFYDRDPLQPMAPALWDEAQWWMLCASCRKALVDADDAEMRWVWSGLPSMFGVKIDGDGWPSAPGEVQREILTFGPVDDAEPELEDNDA